ncbi:response regulator [Haliangium sp.]|uniref:response regulator n=1 Tax=Haliangium sp. TaxID=2663208 RepID=UPI003D129A56
MEREPAVLIVDDNPEMAENLQEILEDEGIRARVAFNGPAALDLLSGGHFDLVITDVRMPGMSGLAVLEAIQSRWPRLPVIVMSAYSSDAELAKAHSRGALDVLAKPLDIGHIIDLVQRVTDDSAPVLLVEDDRDLRVNLSEALLDVARVVPHTASDLTTARRLAAEIDFQVAIIDARLPDGDGLTFGAELRARDNPPSIIYITGYAGELDNLAAILRSPSTHLLEKPFAADRLLALIRSVV